MRKKTILSIVGVTLSIASAIVSVFSEDAKIEEAVSKELDKRESKKEES